MDLPKNSETNPSQKEPAFTASASPNMSDTTKEELESFKGDNSKTLPNIDGNKEDMKSKPLEMATGVDSDEMETGSIADASSGSGYSSDHVKQGLSKRHIDTAQPFESVKEAVSKFGGIVDWKAHKAMTVERQKTLKQELKKAQEEIPGYKKQSEAAEVAKEQVLKELESTKRLVEELKLSLEKAQTEEAQAKQDSELAQLRAQEVEQGITDDASVAAKTQLKVAKARHEAAVAELKSIKEELEQLKGNYALLVRERDSAMNRAEEAISASKEIEKTVEDLTLELITAKESLEQAHAAHLEAEENRINVALAKEEESQSLQKELKQAERELQELSEKLLLSKDLKIKLDTATNLLFNLKAELAAYMEAKLIQEKLSDETLKEGVDPIQQQELIEEVKLSIEKARDEVNCLRVAASSLQSDLEREKQVLIAMKQREEMASLEISALETELSKTRKELQLILASGKESKGNMEELPKALKQAEQEAEQAKSLALMAREELRNAKEEAEQAKASATAMETMLNAALKEIEASNASEMLAITSVKALEESQNTKDDDKSPNGVTLPLEEYNALCRRASEAEELANEKVIKAVEEINEAKASETASIKRLEEASKAYDERKEALKAANEAAERAQEGKLGVEQELRTWRAEHEQKRKADDAAHLNAQSSEEGFDPNSFVEEEDEDDDDDDDETDDATDGKMEASDGKSKKKKSFFPRFVMFLARKKAQSLK